MFTLVSEHDTVPQPWKWRKQAACWYLCRPEQAFLAGACVYVRAVAAGKHGVTMMNLKRGNLDTWLRPNHRWGLLMAGGGYNAVHVAKLPIGDTVSARVVDAMRSTGRKGGPAAHGEQTGSAY